MTRKKIGNFSRYEYKCECGHTIRPARDNKIVKCTKCLSWCDADTCEPIECDITIHSTQRIDIPQYEQKSAYLKYPKMCDDAKKRGIKFIKDMRF